MEVVLIVYKFHDVAFGKEFLVSEVPSFATNTNGRQY